MKVVVHSGKTEKIWKYSYVPLIGEEVFSKVARYKVTMRAYSPEDDTLHIHFKKIEEKGQKKPSVPTVDVTELYEKQRSDLIDQITEDIVKEYGADLCQNFYEYWTEKIVIGNLAGQCRYAEQKTWSIKRRLNTWRTNNTKK